MLKPYHAYHANPIYHATLLLVERLNLFVTNNIET